MVIFHGELLNNQRVHGYTDDIPYLGLVMVGWPPQTSKEISSSEGGETLTRGAGPGAS